MRIRLVLVLTVVALVVAACGEATPDAATVDGNSIERSTLDEELGALMANEGYRSRVAEAQGETPGEPSTLTEQSVPSGLAAFWLSRLIYQEIVDTELAQLGIEPSEEQRQAARADMEAEFGLDVLSGFPEWFQDRLEARTANFNALGEELVGPLPTEEDLEAFFEENRERYAAECPSGRNVSHILVDDEAQAEQIIAELEAGADFTMLAAERSTDPSAATNGGALGCVDQAFVPEFAEAAAAATPGVPAGPTETDFGFHVILVEDAPVTFEALRARVEADLAASTADPFTQFFEERLDEVDVEVDPRYGEWVVAGAVSQVQPPTPPAVRDGREPGDELDGGTLFGG